MQKWDFSSTQLNPVKQRFIPKALITPQQWQSCREYIPYSIKNKIKETPTNKKSRDFCSTTSKNFLVNNEKKEHSKILHKSQTAYKRRSLLLHFPTALSSRSIWQRAHSAQNIKVRASLHREPWKNKAAVKLQLLSSKVLGRLLLFTFLFPPPLAQYWAKRQCLCA